MGGLCAASAGLGAATGINVHAVHAQPTVSKARRRIFEKVRWLWRAPLSPDGVGLGLARQHASKHRLVSSRRP